VLDFAELLNCSPISDRGVFFSNACSDSCVRACVRAYIYLKAIVLVCSLHGDTFYGGIKVTKPSSSKRRDTKARVIRFSRLLPSQNLAMRGCLLVTQSLWTESVNIFH
jgi:uncharacterized protein (DUF2147 family)